MKSARGRVCLERGPSACTGQPMLCGYVLEPDNESGGDAQVVLRLASSYYRSHGESGQQVFRLKGTNGEVIKQLVIHTAARGHGKCILCADCAKNEPVGVCRTEEYLSKRRDLAEVAVRHARPEQIGADRAAVAGGRDGALVVSAEVRHTA